MLRLNAMPLVGVFVSLLSVGLWSCVDNRYDLDRDIDMTINVGGDYLSLPGGSTDTTYLSKIIDEGDLLTTDAVTHEYQLTKADVVTVEPTTVKTFDIERITSDLKSIDIVSSGSSSVTSPISTEVETSGDFTKEVTEIDDALKELGSLSAQTPGLMAVTFDFEGLKFDKVEAKELKVQLPDFLDVRECTDGQHTTVGDLQDGNVLLIDNEVLSTGDDFTTYLEVTGYTFGSEAGNGVEVTDGKITIDGDISISGTLVTTLSDASISGGTLSFTPSAVLETMTINKVTGVIQPSIEVDPTNVELDDMPDFLKDEDTRLDITNPTIAFNVTNDLETPVVVDVTLASHRNGETGPLATVNVKNLEIDAACRTTIVLSRLAESDYADAAHVKNVQVADINNLWERIPDYITVEMNPQVTNSDYYSVELGRAYDMPADYDVLVPLSFENGLTILYTDSISDLNSDLSDLDQADFKEINLQFTALSTIPLQLELKPENVIIKDIYGREVESIEVTTDGKKVLESADGSTPAESGFTVTLTSGEAGVLSRVDCISFKLTAVPGQAVGVPLRDNQWIQMSKINLSIPGGVKVDLN